MVLLEINGQQIELQQCSYVKNGIKCNTLLNGTKYCSKCYEKIHAATQGAIIGGLIGLIFAPATGGLSVLVGAAIGSSQEKPL